MVTIKLNTQIAPAARQLGRQITTNALSIVVITLLLSAAIVGVARWPQPETVQPALARPAPIIIQKEREIQIKYVVATPTAQPTAPSAPQAAPAAAEAPAPTPWVADPQIVQENGGSTVRIEVPTTAPRYCTGFGDWRDHDQHYASSPACKVVQP